MAETELARILKEVRVLAAAQQRQTLLLEWSILAQPGRSDDPLVKERLRDLERRIWPKLR
jgi:hypothetical protein